MAEATGKDIQKKEAEVVEGAEHTRAGKVYTPLVDIMERTADIVLTADMPGVDEHNVDVTLEKNVLTIYGHVEPKVPAGHRLLYSEYGVGDYRRSFTLTDEIDRDHIEASVRDGVLTLVLPKAQKMKTRKIEVKAAA